MIEPCPVQITEVKKSFHRKEVLRGVSLEIPSGAVLGLLGTNGSGKTTLMKCALGLLRPQSGECRLLGEAAWDLSAQAKARIGYVPQVITLYPWMRVRQLITYTAAFYPNWNHNLAERLRCKWTLADDDRVGGLSVGQLQTLAILLALGHDPDLLILDEPAASLDPMARREFLKIIIDLAEPGKRTILFSTHITSDLERVADSVAILRAGRIQYHGLIEDLKDQVKRLRIVGGRELPHRLGIPGTLRERVHGCEALVSVQGVTDALVAKAADDWQARVDVQSLNLEDIFLEMHHD